VPAPFKAYAAALAGEAEHYGVRLGEPRYDDDDGAAKLDVVHDLRPEAVSFTFGLPTMGGCSRPQNAGITTVATVTTVLEAEMALAHGAGALVAQGPSAGGHRATFSPAAQPACQPLAVLLAALSARVDAPIIAAGGLATSDDVNGVISAGAVAAQLGTAFLLAHEAGTIPCTGALKDPNFTETVVTRAFTGRSARGLRNRFIDEHEAEAPFGFPEIGRLTGPLQAASSKGSDPHGMALWAGTAFRQARAGSTAEIIAELT
jgi:nitronate monooxygenase